MCVCVCLTTGGGGGDDDVGVCSVSYWPSIRNEPA